MNVAKVEGGCLCGAVRYRLNGPALSSSICHCPTCRRAGGAPAVAWFVVRRDHFELLRGELKAFASSAAVIRQFCGRCGSQIVYRNDDAPALIELTTATLDDPEALPPTREIWLSHRLAWEAIDPRREQDPEESHT